MTVPMQEQLILTSVPRVRTMTSSRLKSCKGDPVRWGSCRCAKRQHGSPWACPIRGLIFSRTRVVSRSTKVTTKPESPFMAECSLFGRCAGFQSAQRASDIRIGPRGKEMDERRFGFAFRSRRTRNIACEQQLKGESDMLACVGLGGWGLGVGSRRAERRGTRPDVRCGLVWRRR